MSALIKQDPDAYFGIQEDKVQLNKDKSKAQSRDDGGQHVPALDTERQFQVLSKLQTEVNHGAQAK